MKRLVILAGVLAVSTAAQAQDAEFKHSGEFRLRYYNDMTPSGVKDVPDNKSDIEARTKLGLTLQKGPAAKAHITLIHGTFLGAERGTKNPDATTNPNAFQDFNENNGVIVNEAYGWAAFSEKMFVKAGRFNIDFGGGEFISADDHKMIPTTHEGIAVGYDHDLAKLLVGLVKDKELVAGPGLDSDPEQHRFMVGVDLKNLPEFLNTASLSFSNFNRSENTGAATGAGGAANLQVYGLTLGGEAAGLDYRAVLGMQSGIASKTAAAEIKQDAMMYDIRLGFSMPETMGMKVWANYHSDSGDDDGLADQKLSTYNSLYYNSHKFAGLMDIFGWGNLTYWAVGAEVAPAEDMTVGLGLYGFSKTKENGGVLGTNNDRFAGLRGGLANKSDLGMELDVYAQKKYANGLVIDALVGAFMPGAAFKDAAAKKEATVIQAMLTGTLTF